MTAGACGGTESGTAMPAATRGGGGATTGPAASAASTAAPTATARSEIDIEGVEFVHYPGGGRHVTAPERVAYDRFPPFGGAHDAMWAACNGAIYDRPVRNEHMVHSLEHGAVWIAYDPERVDPDTVALLAQVVEAEPYLMLSPYPGLDRPLSLQSWGHQLKLDDATDPRFDEFVTKLRANPATHPELGATCDIPRSAFDPADPPPFDPTPPGPDAVPVS